MRPIDKIIVHCSATNEGVHKDINWLRKEHKERGFYDVGYHLVIYLNGRVVVGRPVEKPGAHVKGFNDHSIGICYIGGLDYKGRPKDTRTISQKESLRHVLDTLLAVYPDAEILGHRDLSPDVNHDGQITPDEWLKVCPCFDISEI